MASAPLPNASPTDADRFLADYRHKDAITDAAQAAFLGAILNPGNRELRELLAGFKEQGYDFLRTEAGRELRREALERDPASFISETIERGAVASSISDSLRGHEPPAPRVWYDLWQGCQQLLSIYRPIEAVFDDDAKMRMIRAWALGAQYLGGSQYITSARQFLGPDFTVPGDHPLATPSRLASLIEQLDAAEAKSRSDWRAGHFKYSDYTLLKALCAAGSGSRSAALKRFEQEMATRAEKRAALLSQAHEDWRPMLTALLDDREVVHKPLEHPEYIALTKLPRERLGLAFVSALRNARGVRTIGLDAATSVPNGTVSNEHTSLESTLAQILKDLEKRRMHLTDEPMAFALNHAPRESTRLLASVEWTLANHHAPQTHAALEKLGVAFTNDYYRKQWPARIAAIRVKHPLKPPEGDTQGERSRASQRMSDGPSQRSERIRPERDRGPRGGSSNVRGFFGLVDKLLREFTDEAPAGRRPERARDFQQEYGSERFSERRFGRASSRPEKDEPEDERFVKLAGADAGQQRDNNGTRMRSRQFYKLVMEQPEELDALWCEIHAEAYSIASKAAPSAKWLKTTRAIVERHGAVKHQAILMPLLEKYEPTGFVTFLGLGTLRAFIYLSADHPSNAIGHALADFALKQCYVTKPGYGIREEKLGNACVWALANMPDGAGVPFLARVLARTKYPKIRKKIDKALNEAAEAAGIARADLDETTVPTHDLDRNGWREIAFENGRATLVADGSEARLEWTNANGKPVKSPTAAIKEEKERLKEAKADLKELQADLSIQPQRLQKLYVQDRQWAFDDWRERYLEHPLMRWFTRRLVWLVESADGAKVPALPDAGGDTLVSITGEPVDLAQATIRLWHPMDSEPEAIEAWRDRLEELEITQPFAQVWREVYALTDAERATRTYTNRWAAHILKQHQAMTLARINGWTVTARMWVDQANDEPWHLFMPEHNLVAEYWVEGAGGDDPETSPSGSYNFVQTDRVTFYRAPEGAVDSAYGPKVGEPIALDEVSPVVFSEVMRSCDLFTAVASIAADPNWLDRGGDAAHPSQWGGHANEYWYRTNTAELVESGKRRHAMLERIIPRLAIADKLYLNEKSLVVKGTRHIYEIHLGSGACSRSGRHLCIVPANSRKQGKIWLPFEGDRTLSIILSKAVLLAADDKIKDPVILRQL